MENKKKAMKKFEPIDITTADVAFISHGKTLGNAFENAALAMMDVMVNTKQVKPKKKISISISGTDPNSLMFNFLNKLLFYVDSQSLVFSKFKVKIDEKKLTMKAECMGEKVNSKMETKTEVKAATYHQMNIWKENNIWNAKVILDI